MLGFPIRKSSDLSSVDSSPRHIAASHVLHRLLVPRHPPNALKHLQTKMLASTVQFSNNTPASDRTSKPATARCAVLTKTRTDRHDFPERTSVLSGPNSVSTTSGPKTGTCQRSTHEHHRGSFVLEVALPEAIPTPRDTHWRMLLRKEVIQPHLPVRLPCYDFVPIANPTFDSSLPQGVRPPASGVTDFHDVTGGVYKARERIHRSVADLRLLATPTSRGRVADPDPN